MAEEEKVKSELKAEGTLTVERGDHVPHGAKVTLCETCILRMEAGELTGVVTETIVEVADSPMDCEMSDCPERDAIMNPEETEAPTPPKAEKQIYEKGMEGEHIAELF